MSTSSTILDLQWTQLAHDERYHKDVVILPLGERIKHMALHMAKYAGYLAEDERSEPQRVTRVLTDAFIITLATANTLNQDLGRDLDDLATDSADLSRLDLQGVDLAGAKLHGASLALANLTHATLRGADLQGAVLIHA